MIQKIRTFIREKFKWNMQKMHKGYCDYDIYDIDSWFLKIMPNMLKDLKQKTGRYFERDEEFYQDINDMIHCFKEANEDTCEIKNQFGMYSYTNIEWVDREIEIRDYREDMLKKGLLLFNKRFHDLWW